MEHVHPLLALGTFALAVTACDSQFSPSYTGDSLLTIVGRVEITDERESLTVPALAFGIPEDGSILIQDVAVQGRFPSDFRLDVYQPPPKGSYINVTHQNSGEPRLAVAYITAVEADHPDVIRVATEASTEAFGCEVDECDKPCGGKGCLRERTTYCIPGQPDVECYVEESYCPTFRSDDAECTLVPVGHGDPTLKENPYDRFAGFSQNYMVVFLEEPAKAGTVTAAVLGAKKNVPAGYGLYELRAPTEAEMAEAEACIAEAEVRGAAGFNREWGTNLSTLNFDAYCGPQDMNAADTGFRAPFCGAAIDELDTLDEASDARERYIERAMLELGCQMRGAIPKRVEHPARESITVVVGADVQLASWPL